MSNGDIAVVPNLSRHAGAQRASRASGSQQPSSQSTRPRPINYNGRSSAKTNMRTVDLSPTNRVTDKDIPDVMELSHQETDEEVFNSKRKKNIGGDEAKSKYVMMLLAFIVV